MEVQTAEAQTEKTEPVPSAESLYRTKWLMAHNALHDLAHNASLEPVKVWDTYLNELATAEEVAQRPA